MRGSRLRRIGLSTWLAAALVFGVPSAISSTPSVRAGGPLANASGQVICTFNFVFKDSAGTRYIGTASHCIDPGTDNKRVGETVYAGDPASPAGRIGAATPIGTVVVSDGSIDFALVRVGTGVSVNPALPHPIVLRGVASTFDGRKGDPALLTGYGLVAGETVATRTRPAVIYQRDDSSVYLTAPINTGDSGGPIVTADGLALGITARCPLCAATELKFSGPATVWGPTVANVLSRMAGSGYVLALVT